MAMRGLGQRQRNMRIGVTAEDVGEGACFFRSREAEKAEDGGWGLP